MQKHSPKFGLNLFKLNDKQREIKSQIKHSDRLVFVVSMPRRAGKTVIIKSIAAKLDTTVLVVCLDMVKKIEFFCDVPASHPVTYKNIAKQMRYVKKNRPCTVVLDDFDHACNRKTYRAIRAFIHQCIDLNVKVVIFRSIGNKKNVYTKFLSSELFRENVERTTYYNEFFK